MLVINGHCVRVGGVKETSLHSGGSQVFMGDTLIDREEAEPIFFQELGD